MGYDSNHTRQIGRGCRGNRHIASVSHTVDEVLAHFIILRLLGHNNHLRLLGGRYIHLSAARTNGGNRILDGFHGILALGKVKFLTVFRPLCLDQEIALMRQRLPNLLGNERHERMHQFQNTQQHIAQDIFCRQLGLLILAVQARLGQFNIPIAVGIPNEVVDLGGRHAQFIGFHIVGDFADQLIQLAQHPLILQLQFLRQHHLVDGQIHHHKAGGIPDLIGKIAHGLALFHEETHIVAGTVAGDQIEAQRICAELIGHLQRIDAVAQRFGHLAALIVTHQTVDKHGMERLFLHLLHAGEDHTGHPEEDNVVACNQDGCGIPILQVLGLQIRPAHGGEGPQGRGEPGVQHILLASQMLAAAFFALGRVFPLDIDMTAFVAVPGRNLMSPPKLTGNAPIVDIFHPVDIGLGETLRHKLDGAVIDHANRLLGQRLHLHKPLCGNQRLHIVVAAIAGAHIVGIGLRLDQITLLFQVLNNGLAALVTVHALVFAAVFVDLTVIGDHANDIQIVA